MTAPRVAATGVGRRLVDRQSEVAEPTRHARAALGCPMSGYLLAFKDDVSTRTSVRYRRSQRAGRLSSQTARRPDASTRASGAVPEPPLLLTNDEAAAMLHIGRTTLYQLVWSGRLTPVRIGRSVRFTREQLEAFVAELTHETSR